MTNKIVVLCACGSGEEAERLAVMLLEAHLAACVSILMQNRSFYWWKDKIEEAGEFILLIKTSAELFSKVEALLESSHSYEVPEVIALTVSDGSAKYLAWMDAELGG